MKESLEIKSLEALRGLQSEQLNNEIIELRKAQFKLRLVKSSGDLKQTHLIRLLRRAIAQAKTLLHEQKVGQ